MEKKYYPTAFLLVIAIALYFMYGEQFSLKNVDFSAYHDTCTKYQSAKKGTYSKEQIQSLINKVNYLLPGTVDEIKEPIRKEIKACANQLARQLNNVAD